jgi:hypothetical protein
MNEILKTYYNIWNNAKNILVNDNILKNYENIDPKVNEAHEVKIFKMFKKKSSGLVISK